MTFNANVYPRTNTTSSYTTGTSLFTDYSTGTGKHFYNWISLYFCGRIGDNRIQSGVRFLLRNDNGHRLSIDSKNSFHSSENCYVKFESM